MKLLTQPYLLTLNPSSEMNIVWIQSEKTDAFAEYGFTEELGIRLEVQCCEITGLRKAREDGTYGDDPYAHPAVSVWQYIAHIRDLPAGTTVYYRCCGGDTYTKIYWFHTAPEAGGVFRFAQLSDLQSLPDCDRTVHQIGCFHPDFLLFSGDATYVSWQLEQWFDTGETFQSEDSKRKAFFSCMQQENGARLMQYAPLFFAPGNHEPDNMKCSCGPASEISADVWSWSIFMQLFRPLYPEQDWKVSGVRWYSANYGDMHIVSLSVNRLAHSNSHGKTIWLQHDSIEPESRQIRWLKEDLKHDRSKFKWVIQHFHILNRAWDAKFNLCEPVIESEEKAEYPNDRGRMLMDIFSENKVNAVSYGHSHVYERYFYAGTHFIEAAYLSVTFASADSPPHPSGILPVFEDNSRRSFMIAERRAGGLFASGYYAAEEPILFDSYQIADEDGNPVAPG